MKRERDVRFRLAAVVTLALSGATDAMGETPAVAAAAEVPAGAVTLDGRLDESAWRRAEVIDLTQQDPHPGAPTPYATEVRVLADGPATIRHNLYRSSPDYVATNHHRIR
jgi:hypothetical protein